MNDLEAIDNYIEKCREFVNPKLLYDIQSRGLYDIINYLPRNVKEAKSIARARLAKIGRCFGDAEIDNIANTIKRLEWLKNALNQTNIADADKILPLLNEMIECTEYIKNYYK